MKKLLIFLLLLAVSVPTAWADNSQTVLVGLFYGSSAKSEVTLVADGVSTTYRAADVTDPVVVTAHSPIHLGDASYRGSIILQKDGNGNLTIINQVPMESYIASLLAKEMSPSFHMEALKAQAVCARTYALRQRGKHGASGFDVCTTQHCQVYGGAGAEHPNTIQAANETAGQVLTYQGALIEAVYYATSGGYTESAQYVWGNEVPYLQAVPDEYEGDVYGASWTKEVSARELTNIMAQKGAAVGNVTGVEVLEQTEHGVVTKLKITGDRGEQTYTREQCRTVFPFLLSQAYTVTAPSSAASVQTSGGPVNPLAMKLITGGGLADFTGSHLALLGSSTAQVPVTASNGNYIFTGRGYGHLVGLSQNGANGMAKAGFSYREILQHYYKGTELS